MTTQISRITDDRRSALLLELAEGCSPGLPVSAEFMDCYFQHVLTDELLARHAEDLRGAVTSHLALARARTPGETKLHAFCPQVSTHGWGSGSAIVQIVTDDAPFIVDSIMTELGRFAYPIRLLAHPQLQVTRDDAGDLQSLDTGPIAESWVHIELPRIARPEELDYLIARLHIVLDDVAAVAHDWRAIARQAEKVAAETGSGLIANASTAQQLLAWLPQDNFLFLGYGHYLLEAAEAPVMSPEDGSGLGLLRGTARPLSDELTETIVARREAVLAKADQRSTVRRASYLDEIVVPTLDGDGNIDGAHRILGLFTAKAYNASIETIGFLSDKLAEVRARSGFPADGYASRDLLSVLEEYPRDELFQADAGYLCEMATTVVASRHLRQPLLFARPDRFGCYVSCVVFVPRDRYDTQVRRRIEEILLDAYPEAKIEHAVRLGATPMAMVQFVIRMPEEQRLPDVDTRELESWVRVAVRTWAEEWSTAMNAEFGEVRATQLMETWGPGLDEAYRATHSPRLATIDVQQLEQLEPGGMLANLFSDQPWLACSRRLRLYCDRPIGLTEILPHLINFGVSVVDERVHRIPAADGSARYVVDLGLSAENPDFWGEPGEHCKFLAGFLAVWQERCESDRFNQLIGTAGLSWSQVVILRMVAAYLKQTTPYSREYIQAALIEQPQIAADLVKIFEARFRPGIAAPTRAEHEKEISAAITAALADVPSLDHDRIIRCYLAVICAGLRTSFYQDNPRGSTPPAVIALKLDPRQLSHLPLPRPQFEIWVYGPSVEGVHLRFGRVARGGLRWSNRREDFRTEVLGLVKAQIVKNAVIVPTGAKGCFYPKKLPNPQTQRAAWMTRGRAAYQDFVRALLSVTDNLVDGTVIPPAEVVRHDGDDSYLVVAADKGTAAFSDLANQIAHERGFWLDDAFASGGSTGYDHKAMGITARGAWRSMIRHFSEIGIDPAGDEITAVGIGDMSGDVFGNGMLCSRHLKLVAAFDHRHIFVDPDPDPKIGFEERSRLFALPSSSWADYDAELISTGGGVIARTAKAVSISPQLRRALPALGDAESATPAEIIRAILQAPVDLLWNGGIGTYVKAGSELNTDIGDPANDEVRIDGSQLRCTVVGEGGNLGFSQLGRIEAAQHGIRINTDAIDNSGGVQSSDYEVNIKILLNQVVANGDMTMRQRNDLLKSMTSEIADRVLRTNYYQNVLLGNARYLAETMVGPQERLMQWLEQRGQLDRRLEALPTADELRRRARDGRGLTSPEFAVLVAHAKLSLTDDLLASELPDDAWFDQVLMDYFPPALARLKDAIMAHPLRREIIATQLANTIVDHGGITFVHRAMEETGASPIQIARAFTVLSEVFEMRDYLAAIEALDGTLPTTIQSELYLEFRRQLDRGVRHLLGRSGNLQAVAEEVERYRQGVHDLRAGLDKYLAPAGLGRLRARIGELESQGVPGELAPWVASLLYNVDAIEIVDLAVREGAGPEEVARTYFEVAESVQLGTAQTMLTDLPNEGRWDAAARSSLRQELYRLVGTLTSQVMASDGDDLSERMSTWRQAHATELTGFSSLVNQLGDEDELGLGQVWVLVRDAQRLAGV